MIKHLLLLLVFVSYFASAQFSSNTKIKADSIENNTGTDIILNPSDKVDIQYFTGSKALQSTVDGELEESAVTNTELGYVSGVTSGIQGQIDGKQDILPLTTDGDILFYNAGFARLPIGAVGQVLTVNGSLLPEWQDIIAVSVTTKGDLQTYSTQPDRLGVGSDGQILSANSATSTGLEWIDFSASPTTTLGDLIYRGSTEDVRLPIGSQDQLLSVGVTGEPVWIDPPSTSPTVSAGDIIYNDGGGLGSDTFLPIGSEGNVLSVTSGLPTWEEVIGTTLTAKAELQSHNGTDNEAVSPPTANGQFLVSDDTQSTGMIWVDPQPITTPSILFNQAVNTTVSTSGGSSTVSSVNITGVEPNAFYKVTFAGRIDANLIGGPATTPTTCSTYWVNAGGQVRLVAGSDDSISTVKEMFGIQISTPAAYRDFFGAQCRLSTFKEGSGSVYIQNNVDTVLNFSVQVQNRNGTASSAVNLNWVETSSTVVFTGNILVEKVY